MIQTKQSLTGYLSAKQSLTGKINNAVVKEYPKLENITITPSAEEQVFKPKGYGFETIVVERVETEELNIIPSFEEQTFNGIFGNVNVEEIKAEDFVATPSAEEQTQEGIFKSVTIAGDSNLVADNIKDGASIFGVQGNYVGDVPTITNLRYFCYYGERVDQLNELLKICKPTLCNYMFSQASSITSIDLRGLDFSNCVNAYGMYHNCTNLTDLDMTDLDMGKLIVVSSMFASAKKITNLKFGKNLGKSYTTKTANASSCKVDLSGSALLTHESAMSIKNGVYDLNLSYDVANGGTLYAQTIQFSTETFGLLSETDIAEFVAKGWNVAAA